MLLVALVGSDPWIALGLERLLANDPSLTFVGAAHRVAEIARTPAGAMLLEGIPATVRAAVQHSADAGTPTCLVAPAIGTMAGADVRAVPLARDDDPGEVLDRLRSSVESATHGPRARRTVKNPAGLSPQECRVLGLVAQGASADVVASELGIARGTVAAYLRRIRDKYELVGRPAPTRLHLYHRAVEDHLLPAVAPFVAGAAVTA